MAVTLGDERNIEGEIGLEQLALAPAFALAMGAAGHDAAEPLSAGLVKGWRGKVAFQALRGALPGGSELQPVSGVVRSDGKSLKLRCHQGQDRRRRGHRHDRCAAGCQRDRAECERSARRRRRHGAALSQSRDAAGRASLQMTLTSQGRSASALTDALSGSGTVTLDAAKIAGP